MCSFSVEFERLNNSIREVSDALEITVDKLRKDNNEKCKTLAKTMKRFYKKMSQVEIAVAIGGHKDHTQRKDDPEQFLEEQDQHKLQSQRFPCQKCGKVLQTAAGLKEHLHTVHGINPSLLC